MKFRTILLLGAPGSGKGTQGKILGTIPNFYHCACGDVFRNLNVDSPLGQTFIEYSSRGELVPDEATVNLWRDNIQANTMLGHFNPKRDTLVLDGIPRNVHQAKMLTDTLDVRMVLNLTCPDMDQMVARLQRRALRDNRLDDANLDVIRHRLKLYEDETQPVIEFYGANVGHHIDATQSPADVLRRVLEIIGRSN